MVIISDFVYMSSWCINVLYPVRLWYDPVRNDQPMRVSGELLDGSARLIRPGMAVGRASVL
jgi:hypothetical protein